MLRGRFPLVAAVAVRPAGSERIFPHKIGCFARLAHRIVQMTHRGRPMAARLCKIYDRMRRGRCPHRPKSLPSGGRWLRREAEQTDEGMEHSPNCIMYRFCSPTLIRPSVCTGGSFPGGEGIRCGGKHLDILLGHDIDDAARGDAERRDDRQRHEAERHERVDALLDAEPEGRLFRALELFVHLSQRAV